MELEPDNQRRILLARVAGSVAAFTLFAVLVVSWILTQDPTLKWALFVPLVLSVLILPRDVPDEIFADERRSKLKLWLSYVRVAYFLLAVFLMLGLPELLY